MTVVLETVRMRLHDIAHGRSGDKGNRSNISLIPYQDAAYQLLCDQVSEEKVLALFAHKGASAVKRYELPNLPALNFVIDDALEGGVNSTLNLDLHGKTLSFMLLDMPIDVPLDLIDKVVPEGRRQA